jgi:hypothetical protein
LKSDGAAERGSTELRQAARSRLALEGLFAVASWVVVAVKGGDIAYMFATTYTIGFLVEAARPWARAAGVPEWRADEAYVTRLRRWWRSRSGEA